MSAPSEPAGPAGAGRLHAEWRGSGRPLLLVHGLGSTWRSWDRVLPGLAARREVIAVDLPGFGASPPLAGEVSIATLCDAVADFMTAQGLPDVDLVGSSMGARIVLELARRGLGGATVALDPGGFWTDGQRRFFGATITASIALVRRLQPLLPALSAHPAGRTALLAQFSARPWSLPAELVLTELRSYGASPSLDAALHALVHGPKQQGAPAGTRPGRLVIGWGRQDHVLLPSQARRAVELFPDAELHWFDHCGHFPQWDQPEQTVELVLEVAG